MYLLLGDVNGLVNDDPDSGLPAAGVCGGAFVRHVVGRVGQQAVQGQVPDGIGRP